MIKNKVFKNSLLFLGCVGIVLIFRIIPHPPNFTPVIALSLYLPIIFGIWSLPFCILGFAITDYFIGFHCLLIFLDKNLDGLNVITCLEDISFSSRDKMYVQVINTPPSIWSIIYTYIKCRY